MNILFVDLETTGTNPREHSIMQIAAELYVDGKAVATFNKKVKQDHATVDLGALKVNNIKMRSMDSYGDPEFDVLKDFVDFLLDINSKHKDIYLGGHNVSFDVNFLTELFNNYRVSNMGAILPYRTLDTSSIGLFLRSIGILNIEKFNSGNLYKALGLDMSDKTLHEALSDVRLTAQAFFKMQEMIKNLPSRFETILAHKTEFKTQLDNLMDGTNG